MLGSLVRRILDLVKNELLVLIELTGMMIEGLEEVKRAVDERVLNGN